ncbi:MAG: flagellar basal body M-ring protein FliF [Gammaproteobacteria bacterium]|uniref:flagellar basal-body MS-ring/collar protein FliF n=1 Tax=Pseudomaricurvus alcaniphilus TaxID=1166482 RepID=UPI001407CA26|nr:flagellar basal-body MS-ring/collar protein FliF [Pseudomaricurvus alcaniphilus]MBR9911629.1 flagellar basal body M-ring protein FliF [Gammaproteobacteria bacterium]NHN39427.1 flagellar basal body M-ring protein FliF [Pseudomaricurvus alcaniphilus]
MATAETELPSGNSGAATNDLIEGFNNLNLVRQAGLMVGLAASVAIGFAVVLWSQGEDYRPLYGSLDRLDSAEVVEILETNDITFKIDGASGALLVAQDQVHKARLKLAEAGLPGESSAGFELLDQEQPLGTSQFMENARYRRSLEGELARTITSINAVRSARVHLAIPKQAVFVREPRRPSASVFVELFPGRGIQPQQVKAIANLVASSIPELTLDNVTVVDQKGNLLSVIDEDQELVAAGRQRDYTRKIETDITQRINGILDPIIGTGNFKAEVSADIDFTEVEQAEEVFNPDLPAVRSEQTLEEARTGSAAAAGIPGALTNQPPGNGAAPEQAGARDQGEGAIPQNSRRQATRNFELDRTVSYTKHQLGKVNRLSVAVVVDDRIRINPETGEAMRQPWSENELERLSILVRDAVGFSAARGDSVNVLNSPFLVQESDAQLAEVPIWEQPWFLSILKQVVGLLIILVLLLGLLRPVLKSLTAGGVKAREEERAREAAALESAGLDSFEGLSDETVTLTGGQALALPSPEESYEQQLNAVKGMIAEDPGRVAQVIKSWVKADE